MHSVALCHHHFRFRFGVEGQATVSIITERSRPLQRSPSALPTRSKAAIVVDVIAEVALEGMGLVVLGDATAVRRIDPRRKVSGVGRWLRVRVMMMLLLADQTAGLQSWFIGCRGIHTDTRFRRNWRRMAIASIANGGTGIVVLQMLLLLL